MRMVLSMRLVPVLKFDGCLSANCAPKTILPPRCHSDCYRGRSRLTAVGQFVTGPMAGSPRGGRGRKRILSPDIRSFEKPFVGKTPGWIPAERRLAKRMPQPRLSLSRLFLKEGHLRIWFVPTTALAICLVLTGWWLMSGM